MSEHSEYEQKVLQEIVNIIPIADIPELIQSYVPPYNPFDQDVLCDELFQELVPKIRNVLKNYGYIEFNYNKQICDHIPGHVLRKFKCLLIEAGYVQVDEQFRFAKNLPCITSHVFDQHTLLHERMNEVIPQIRHILKFHGRLWVKKARDRDVYFCDDILISIPVYEKLETYLLQSGYNIYRERYSNDIKFKFL